MPPDVLNEVFRAYGWLGLWAFCACALAGSFIAQRWILRDVSHDLRDVVSLLLKIGENHTEHQANQATSCERHAALAVSTIEAMREIAKEFHSMQETYHMADIARAHAEVQRAHEVASLISQLAQARKVDAEELSTLIADRLVKAHRPTD